MKKLMCGVCSMMLACSMYGSSVAYGETVKPGDYNTEVNATYTETAGGGTVYSVDIEWGKMKFDYKAPGSGTWNPQTHKYEGATTEGTWDYKEGNNISATNHSNAAVNVALSGTPDTNKFDGDVSFNFYESNDATKATTGKQIISAEGENVESPKLKFDTVLKINGKLKSEVATEQTIGNVTVMISPVTPSAE